MVTGEIPNKTHEISLRKDISKQRPPKTDNNRHTSTQFKFRWISGSTTSLSAKQIIGQFENIEQFEKVRIFS